MGRTGAMESRADRAARARSLAGFFAAGAVLTSLVILLPGWDGVHEAGMWVTVAMAAGGAGLLALLAERLPPLFIHLMTGTGTVLIAACQVLAGGGSPSAMYAMLYIWVILHSALFFGRAVVATHLLVTALAQVGALLWLGEVASIGPQLSLTLVTQVSAALVVGSLTSRQRRLADTDALTGLANRRVAERALEASLARSGRRPAVPTCVAMFDLDGFKAFNDEWGHVAGDLVLVEAAAVWRDQIRRTDTLARTGGDEFMLVLADCSLDDAQRTVTRMVTATPEVVACSAGLARWDGRESAIGLIKRVDRALYHAKIDGPLAVASEGGIASAWYEG
jgi:diguanylate cyclase (GGDEF)-like protein